MQDAEEKDPVAPDGKPDTEKETDWVLPDTRVAVMELVPEAPQVTDISPELVIKKSNGRLLASRKSQLLTMPTSGSPKTLLAQYTPLEKD